MQFRELALASLGFFYSDFPYLRNVIVREGKIIAELRVGKLDRTMPWVRSSFRRIEQSPFLIARRDFNYETRFEFEWPEFARETMRKITLGQKIESGEAEELINTGLAALLAARMSRVAKDVAARRGIPETQALRRVVELYNGFDSKYMRQRRELERRAERIAEAIEAGTVFQDWRCGVFATVYAEEDIGGY